MMMMDTSLSSEVRGKFDKAVEFMGRTAMWSEKALRVASWGIAHQIAQTATRAFADGKIGMGKLRERLMLDTMMLSQRAELDRHLTNKDYDMFIRRYAEYKTDSVNFSYDTALRSALEQTPTGRAIAGIMVFPRGVYNIAVTNGLLPMYYGSKKGDTHQAAMGLRNIAMLAIGSYTTNWAYEQIMGKKGTYSPLGLAAYSPGAPGLNLIYDTAKEISTAIYLKEQGEKDTKVTALAIVGTLAKQAEFMIPISDAFIRLYANSKNIEDVKLWGMVRSELNRKYAKQVDRKHERTQYEKLMHLMVGGFNKAEKKK
jgi:hypothetical protein